MDNEISSRSLKQLSVLHSIVQIITNSSGQKQMLDEVLNTLRREMGMCRGAFMLSTPDGQELVVEAASDEQIHSESHLVRYRRGEGITGRVLATGQPAVVPRIADEPEFRSRIHPRRQKSDREYSFICVPIMLKTEIIGTFGVDILAENLEHLQELQRFLSIVAALVSNDLHHRRDLLIEKQNLAEENVRLKNELREKYRPDNIIGNSNSMRMVYQKIQQVAASNTTVLIRGETGTGKELVASAIHYAGPRSEKAFVKVNCSALNENVLESELFGHEKGAFTGAMQTRIGRLEEADGGTLFLDEIGDFSPTIQVKLLRVLQEKEFQRVGSNTTIKTDVRIIAATNRNLEQLVQQNLFRPDFYYRVNVFPIYLPPLRERKDDLLLLADHFVKVLSHKLGKKIRRISTTAINMMMTYHWPGNVRELENCIEHAILLSDDGVIHGYHLPPTLQVPTQQDNAPQGTLKSRVSLLERDMIVDSLKRHSGRISRAAQELGITERMLRYKIKKMNINYEK
ncbi:MAG: sigma 54-interacting transcriptional regulator [Anaerohalosphaeraceae bacterium]